VLKTTETRVKDISAPVNLKMEVSHPQLWSPETPTLYAIVTQVMDGKKIIDEVKTTFGFRTIEWETETGFWLNGENVKLKGVCEHWEGGPVGGAWTKPLLRWKLQLIKDMGNNAIRPSHNPTPPMFYEICDEIGLLVMDEIFDGWHRKAMHDYGAQAFDEWWQRDITEWVTRDRNHPSVFVWSLGNETHGDIAPALVEFTKNLDPTRLITSGSANYDDMEVAGVNGGSELKSFIEKRRFDKPFISTEAPHTWQTRGYYRTQTWWRDSELPNTYPLPNITDKEIFFYEWADPKNWNNRKNRFNSSYDNATVRISARKNWEVMRDNPWHSGHFRWTGFDYYGEAGLVHGGLPFNLFMGGAIDVAGFEKDLFYFYQSQWTKEPMVHILPHWTHPRMEKGTLIPVWVYSNAEEVELFLNGRSLGKDKPGIKAEEMQCEWMVPYEEGKLEAIAYIDGKEVKRTSFETASQPVKLVHSILKLDAEDEFEANYILTSESFDSKNNLYPYAQNKVYYALNGDIKKVSLENGSPVDATSRANSNHRAMFMGKTRAILQAKEKAENAHVVVGSILGDQSLYLSDLISIYAEQLNVIGADKKVPLEILYTIDGSDPLVNGIVYKIPFDVEDGTTVRAIVKQNDNVLFAMEEAFGANEGLFWGNEKSESMWSGRGVTLQAETAIIKGSARISDNARWNRGEVVTFDNQEGSIIWYQENDGDEAEYELRFRYAHNDPENTFSMLVVVNDEEIGTLEFKPTGSWIERWVFVGIKTKFKPGANIIELRTNGKSGPNIDELLIL
jgi:beta-galactosidase